MERRVLIIVVIILVLIAILIGYSYYNNSDSKIIGGCAGVSLENLQECCENWAEDNGMMVIQCVGEWEIKDNQCSWKCL